MFSRLRFIWKFTLARYRNEWLSTTSADFTATLAGLGKSSLQTDETQALIAFETSYQEYAKARDALVAGQGSDETSLSGALKTTDASLN